MLTLGGCLLRQGRSQKAYFRETIDRIRDTHVAILKVEKLLSRLHISCRGKIAIGKAWPVLPLLSGIVLIALLWLTLAVCAADYSEYEIKAAYLYKFSEYVEWPPDVFPDDKAPFSIGILGKDPFGRVLDDTIKGKKVQGRGIVIKRSNEAKDLTGCQMVFVSPPEDSQMKDSLGAFDELPVLTVGESEEFGRQRGMIRFVLVESNVRFEINADSARKAGLKISSQLLKLAKTQDAEEGP